MYLYLCFYSFFNSPFQKCLPYYNYLRQKTNQTQSLWKYEIIFLCTHIGINTEFPSQVVNRIIAPVYIYLTQLRIPQIGLCDCHEFIFLHFLSLLQEDCLSSLMVQSVFYIWTDLMYLNSFSVASVNLRKELTENWDHTSTKKCTMWENSLQMELALIWAYRKR